MAARQHALGREIGCAAQLHDPLRDPVGMILFFRGMFQEFGLYRAGVDALRHEVVAFVTKHADQFGRQRLIQNAAGSVGVAQITACHRAVLDMLPSTVAQLLDVGDERRVGFGIGHSGALPRARGSMV